MMCSEFKGIFVLFEFGDQNIVFFLATSYTI